MLVLRQIAKRALAVAGLVLGFSTPLSVLQAQQPEPPRLAFVRPLGVQPGVETQLQLSGQRLAGTGKIWTNATSAATTASPGTSENEASCQLKLPETTSLGVIGLRYYNQSGVSNLRLLLIDDLSTVVVSGRPGTLATALPITAPTAVEGHCENESACYFKFTAQAEQRISAEVYARRLASPLDPILRVLDVQGNELAYRDDEPCLMGDCRMSFRAPHAGDYYFEVRDVRYAGGPEFLFRLRVGTFPLASVVFPPVVKRGATTKFVAAATEGATSPDLPLEVPADYTGEHWSIRVDPNGNGIGSALLRVEVSDLQQSLEREPNESPEQATELSLPTGVSGRFEQPRDRDWYTFAAQAGDHLSVQARAQSFSSPAEVSIKLFDTAGQKLSESDPAVAEEARLQLAIPASGMYRLLAEDLHQSGGAALIYHLELETKTTGYSLAVDRDRVNPPTAGVCTLKVSANRTHYRGPITLSLRNAPPDVVLSGETIPADQNEATLKIRLPAGCEPGSFYALQVVGTTEQAGPALETVCACTTAVREELRWLADVPGEVTQNIALGVGPAFPPFYKLTLEPVECVLPRLIGTASWQVKVERLHNFSDTITIDIQGLPPGISASGTTIEKGRNDTTIMFGGGEALPAGVTPLELTAEGVLQDQPQTVKLSGALRVIPPLRVSLAMAGALPRAGKQQLTITVERFGKESNPVQVVLQNLPAGVTAPAEIIVPTGVNTLEIELSAALTVQPGKFEQLAAQATTKFQAQDVTAESPFAVLEIVDEE